jgi:hypothetical protein
MLTQIALVGSSPPSFIVTSRLADERLWVEALNVGAYDVLVKPFDVAELKRVFSSGGVSGANATRVPPSESWSRLLVLDTPTLTEESSRDSIAAVAGSGEGA